jgi:hypothetical protein
METANLCQTCKKELDCYEKGIFERESCNQYEPMTIDELLERDEFVRSIIIGDCPMCGSQSTYGCENNPLLEDDTIGHCLDCDTYWCLECGYVFDSIEEGTQCPHWDICDKCFKDHGYLDTVDFMEKVCPSCNYFDSGCSLDEPLECEKQWQYLCPYESCVSDCPEIFQFLQGRS